MEPLSATLIVAAVLIGLLMLFWGFIAFALYSSVEAMTGPRFRLQKADEGRHQRMYQAAAEFNPWAGEQGFEWIGGYLITVPQKIFIAAWEHADTPRYFCIYTHHDQNTNQVNDYFDFVTLFDQDQALTTSGSKDAFTLPQRPGSHLQVFPEAEVDEMWEFHQQAEKKLQARLGVQFTSEPVDFEQDVTKAIATQMAYVKSKFLWPVRGVFWYLTRGSQVNRPVE